MIIFVQYLRVYLRNWYLMFTDLSLFGISGKNRLLLTALHRNFVGPFTAKEAAEALRLSAPECHRLLSYLSGRGWLTRIRRGLYGLVSLDSTHPQEWVGDPWVLAAKLYGPSYYIGGWSACEHWDLTEQLFRETVVVTSRRARRRDPLIHGFPLLVRFTSEAKIFGISFVWRDQTRVSVSNPSRTVVDLLSDPLLGGGIRHVADVLETHYRSDHWDEALLGDYVGRLGNRTAYKRLGYLVETLRLDAPNLLRECEFGMSSGISLLDPSLPARGTSLRRWNLRVNATVLPVAA